MNKDISYTEIIMGKPEEATTFQIKYGTGPHHDGAGILLSEGNRALISLEKKGMKLKFLLCREEIRSLAYEILELTAQPKEGE